MIWRTEWQDPTLRSLMAELAGVEAEASRLLLRAHQLRMKIIAYPGPKSPPAPNAAPFRLLSGGEEDSGCG
jgi:hypothetical protein